MSRPGMWQGYDDGYGGAMPRPNGDEEYYIAYGLASRELEDSYAPHPEPTAEELCGAYTQHGVPGPLEEALAAVAAGFTVSCHCGTRDFAREELCAAFDDPDPEG